MAERSLPGSWNSKIQVWHTVTGEALKAISTKHKGGGRVISVFTRWKHHRFWWWVSRQHCAIVWIRSQEHTKPCCVVIQRPLLPSCIHLTGRRSLLGVRMAPSGFGMRSRRNIKPHSQHIPTSFLSCIHPMETPSRYPKHGRHGATLGKLHRLQKRNSSFFLKYLSNLIVSSSKNCRLLLFSEKKT